ncbi:hypothetical protein BLOT_007744 [Blomia tropicalis]|nr:hypothetical protein BLOT_007744 [Blomia tropicalis]
MTTTTTTAVEFTIIRVRVAIPIHFYFGHKRSNNSIGNGGTGKQDAIRWNMGPNCSASRHRSNLQIEIHSSSHSFEHAISPTPMNNTRWCNVPNKIQH